MKGRNHMNSLFNLLGEKLESVVIALIVIAIAFLISCAFTFLVSLKLRGTKSFFITSAIMPMIVASVVSMVSIFLDSATTGAVRIATIAVAFGLIRFRSQNAKAEELLLLYAGIACGLISGLGYVVIAAILAFVIAGLYLLFMSTKAFSNKRFSGEKLLKITIPETLEYNEVFDDTFAHYLKSNELIEVKTTAMGSLFRLSYRVELKNQKEEKEFIDELRVKNGNLEIAILPFVGEEKCL